MAKRIAQVGEAVLHDGQMHLVVDTIERYSKDRGELVTLVIFENPLRKVTALLEDLRWDDECNCFYSWGRVLAHGDNLVVAELRDRGLLPARKTRNPGNVPAGGEHLNLYKQLFRDRASGFWETALSAVRVGGSLPAVAQAAIKDYGVVFKEKLVDGYADPTFDDSVGEE